MPRDFFRDGAGELAKLDEFRKDRKAVVSEQQEHYSGQSVGYAAETTPVTVLIFDNSQSQKCFCNTQHWTEQCFRTRATVAFICL